MLIYISGKLHCLPQMEIMIGCLSGWLLVLRLHPLCPLYSSGVPLSGDWLATAGLMQINRDASNLANCCLLGKRGVCVLTQSYHSAWQNNILTFTLHGFFIVTINQRFEKILETWFYFNYSSQFKIMNMMKHVICLYIFYSLQLIAYTTRTPVI